LTTAEGDWVAETLAGLDAWPAYYVHMQPENLAGPAAPDLAAPKQTDRESLTRRLKDGAWVVDLRAGAAFADGHVTGTVNIGLDGQFVTYVGWLIPWDKPLTLLGESADQVAEAQRELVRIGVDHLEGAAIGSPQSWAAGSLGSYPRATFADLAQVRDQRSVTVLDVRRDHEFAASHLEGAVHVPIHEVLARIDEVPTGELWVHCGSGYRAAIVTSLLAARSYDVVLIDDNYDEHAGDANVPLATS
jgi:prepilin-type processing-associated H-X9-DG protein